MLKLGHSSKLPCRTAARYINPAPAAKQPSTLIEVVYLRLHPIFAISNCFKSPDQDGTMPAQANVFNNRLDVELRGIEEKRRKTLEAVLAGHQSALHHGTAMDFHPDYMISRYRAHDEDKGNLDALLAQAGTDPESFWRDVESQAMEFELAGDESVGEYRRRILALKREERGF
ncbi:hypothetical protein QFC20_003711 [Naganishia adeliensis]|uniref:Uncharacterized protein n=1 Tax=Naganishia adeliensis TaxID=92952 RepID=A0ACC2W8M2_9TREE|nr:hypothetical protein QFC20_003711 [Naganishia adeliensis]